MGRPRKDRSADRDDEDFDDEHGVDTNPSETSQPAISSSPGSPAGAPAIDPSGQPMDPKAMHKDEDGNPRRHDTALRPGGVYVTADGRVINAEGEEIDDLKVDKKGNVVKK